MDIQVKHGSTDITSRVVGYTREHNICSGIGRLQITLEGTYSTSISPHDTISIHENGDFKVKYYVSDVDKNVPDGTIVLQCQDRSKYLVDYFISESYTIDYPSYTRTWIELFFDQAGITYEFTTDSPGNLLSNYTQLGLQPAYDQIMMLCQLSGWYFYFDGNGKAIIGSLTTDLSSGGSVGMDDILDIKKITDDKMLRNRAVVWGQYDTIRQEYAYADISKHTPWNYDHDDLRAMVISNNNIPNRSSAYSIANILLKEFAKITTEKHLTLHGARDLNLGETLGVHSHVWRGKGLITTFGVTMDRNGLVTNLILDERCPRLFGFFDFGDYVYVGTFGDGVWRKHIKFDPTWYNFSTGLTNLNITDLHINNGVFGSVGHSGNMYIANSESGPWVEVSVESLPSSAEDSFSGVLVDTENFSGIMARATIVDKQSNNVKFAVDTWSGLNTGDYFLTYSGLFSTETISGIITASGTVTTSGHRAWVLEYDPFTGQLVGGLGSGIYPISYSGNYDVIVLDLENDGMNDYVSVAISSGVSTPIQYNYNFGRHTSYPPYGIGDPNSRAGFISSPFDLEGQSLYTSLSAAAQSAVSVFNNESIDERDVVWLDATAGNLTFKRVRFEKTTLITSSTITSPTQTGIGAIVGIAQIAAGVYRIFHTTHSAGTSTTDGTLTMKYREWDTDPNTVTSDTVLDVITDPPITPDATSVGVYRIASTITIGDMIYTVYMRWNTASTGIDSPNRVKLYSQIVNMVGLSVDSGLRTTIDFEEYLSPDPWVLETMTSTNPFAGIFQNGSVANYGLWVQENNNSSIGSATILRNWLIYSNDCLSFDRVQVQEVTSSTDPAFLVSTGGTGESRLGANQLTSNSFIFYARDAAGTERPTYIFNGTNVTIEDTPTDVPFWWKASNIYPMFNSIREEYVAKNGSDWWWISATTLIQAIQFNVPVGYNVLKPFITSTSPLEQFYWYARRDEDNRDVIIRAQRAGGIENIIIPYSEPNFSSAKAFIAGNIFVDTPILGGTSTLKVLYLDNPYPETGGGSYLVLQRDGLDYNLIQSGAKPFRIDVSNTSPVLTVQDLDNTFTSNFIYGDELTQIAAISGMGEVRDYRYTLLETSSGMITTSGYPVTNQLLYVNVSGIFTTDLNTFSGGFILFDEVASGGAERIETSNFVYPGQFIFVTTSGENPMFYQRDNDSLFFDSYSGLPDSRATIIRCDDRL